MAFGAHSVLSLVLAGALAGDPCNVELATSEDAKAWMPDSAMASCTSIKVSGSPIYELGGTKLRPVLSRATELSVLDLSHMQLGDQGIKEVATALKSKGSFGSGYATCRD